MLGGQSGHCRATIVQAARSGKPDPWKRDRLIGVGADIVIPDFRDCDALLRFLWREDPADAL